MKYLKLLSFVFILVSVTNLFAQEKNTLELAKKYNSQKEFTKSADLLQVYYNTHKTDLYTGWLYAKTLHQLKDYTKSIQVYKSTIDLFPNNYDLKLDFVNKLVESGNLSEATTQLNTFIPSLPASYKFVAQKKLAQVLYWSGYYDKSNTEIDKALAYNKKDPSALKLKSQIDIARSNWIKLDLGYFSDDQPLTAITPNFESGFYINSNVSIGVNVDYPSFSTSNTNYAIPWVRGFANFNFIESKIGLKTEIGTVSYPSKQNSITGMFEFNKKFSKYFNFVLNASYKPYLATTFAIKEKLMETHYGGALEYNNPNGYIGRLSVDDKEYSSINNSYYTISGWVVTPPFKLDNFDFRMGYGINYSDSKNNTFVTIESLSYIIANTSVNSLVNGNYNPFFSPNSQLIHSAIGTVKYTFNKNTNFGIDLNYGFSASANTPNLTLVEDGSGVKTIKRSFNSQNYNPMDVYTYLNFKVSNTLNFKAYYKYQRTYYYASNFTGIKATIAF